MEAPQTLRPPANWQDFETLCKKLWGEKWNCSDIKKNGRNGDNQHGVDLYGIPHGETQYCGIQCKGKDEYTHKQFTKEEIILEIEKAKKFIPPLRTYYLATTAVKNAVIEQFVREKNIEHIKSGIFSIELYSWEDIVELIDENKQTHDWYIKNKKYKSRNDAGITFQNNSTEIALKPKFKKTITHFKQKIIPADPAFSNPLSFFMNQHPYVFGLGLVVGQKSHFEKINLSYSCFKILILNTGTDPIENLKLTFEFKGEIVDITDTNEISSDIFPKIRNRSSTTHLYSETKNGEIVPKSTILVSGDTVSSDEIYIKAAPTETNITISWKLLSKDFKSEGKLLISLHPEIEKEYKEHNIEDPLQVKVVQGDIEDYIIEKKEDHQ